MELKFTTWDHIIWWSKPNVALAGEHQNSWDFWENPTFTLIIIGFDTHPFLEANYRGQGWKRQPKFWFFLNQMGWYSLWAVHGLGSVRDRSPPPSPVGASGHGATQPVAPRGLGSQISIISDNLTHFRPKHEAKGLWSLNTSSLKSEVLETLLGTELCPVKGTFAEGRQACFASALPQKDCTPP